VPSHPGPWLTQRASDPLGLWLGPALLFARYVDFLAWRVRKRVPSGSSHLVRGAASAHYTTSAPGTRDSCGQLIRSEAAKSEFIHETGYARGRPGYVVDHIVRLKRGGCDCPANMQWQTVAEGKAKDKWE
jgi:hypothetical protein